MRGEEYRSVFRVGGLAFVADMPLRVPREPWTEDFWSHEPDPTDDLIALEVIRASIAVPATGRRFRIGQSYQGFESDGVTTVVVQGSHQTPHLALRYEKPLERATLLLSPEAVAAFDGPLARLATMVALLERDGILLHGVGAVLEGRAVVFLGRSGAGKSTLAKLLDSRFELLSDERVVVRYRDGQWMANGTPWVSDCEVARNTSAPLAALSFLEHAIDNQVRPIHASVDLLFPCATVPLFDAELTGRAMSFLHSLAVSVPGHVLAFSPEPGVDHAVTELLG